MEQIHRVLGNYMPVCQAAVIRALGSAGGMSGAQFWRIELPSRVYILRRWPREHPSPGRLTFIHAVLRHAAGNGCGILPLPVTTQRGETFIDEGGYLWELAPWMPGVADYERGPTVEKLRAAMRALASFHQCVADFSMPDGPDVTPPGRAQELAPKRHLARLRSLTPALIGELASLARYRIWPELAAPAQQFVLAMPMAVPRTIAQLESLANVKLPQQVCLRDIWHDHVLFSGDVVTGLVDFGAVDIDTPATDVARLLGSLGDASSDAATTWREGIEAYSTARRLSDDETRTAYALDASAPILAGCNWIRWIYGEGRHFEDRARVLTRFCQILKRVERSSLV